VISRFGVFVIESKDYKGWIFGAPDNEKWTQSLPGGTVKSQFQNPIRQNFAHMMALKELMPFAGDNFISIVVFTDKSEFKTPPIPNVVHLHDLIACIKKYETPRLSEEQVQLAIGKLSYACQTIDLTINDHIENLQIRHPAHV
jgi:hypothetical protein